MIILTEEQIKDLARAIVMQSDREGVHNCPLCGNGGTWYDTTDQAIGGVAEFIAKPLRLASKHAIGQRDKVQQAVEEAKEERRHRDVLETIRREAINFGVCPDCGGKLNDATGFFRRYIINNERLCCSVCGAAHVRRINICP